MRVADVLNWHSGRLPRKTTDWLIVHCSATQASADVGAAEIHQWHLKKGWKGIGYHFVIKRNGDIERGEALENMGSHVLGFNHNSVGVCMVGGLNKQGTAENNFTHAQFGALTTLLHYLHQTFPKAVVRGHRDFSPDLNKDGVITNNEYMKDCPCFDVGPWWEIVK